MTRQRVSVRAARQEQYCVIRELDQSTYKNEKKEKKETKREKNAEN